jgi:hypothetical protein
MENINLNNKNKEQTIVSGNRKINTIFSILKEKPKLFSKELDILNVLDLKEDILKKTLNNIDNDKDFFLLYKEKTLFLFNTYFKKINLVNYNILTNGIIDHEEDVLNENITVQQKLLSKSFNSIEYNGIKKVFNVYKESINILLESLKIELKERHLYNNENNIMFKEDLNHVLLNNIYKLTKKTMENFENEINNTGIINIDSLLGLSQYINQLAKVVNTSLNNPLVKKERDTRELRNNISISFFKIDNYSIEIPIDNVERYNNQKILDSAYTYLYGWINERANIDESEFIISINTWGNFQKGLALFYVFNEKLQEKQNQIINVLFNYLNEKGILELNEESKIKYKIEISNFVSNIYVKKINKKIKEYFLFQEINKELSEEELQIIVSDCINEFNLEKSFSNIIKNYLLDFVASDIKVDLENILEENVFLELFQKTELQSTSSKMFFDYLNIAINKYGKSVNNEIDNEVNNEVEKKFSQKKQLLEKYERAKGKCRLPSVDIVGSNGELKEIKSFNVYKNEKEEEIFPFRILKLFNNNERSKGTIVDNMSEDELFFKISRKNYVFKKILDEDFLYRIILNKKNEEKEIIEIKGIDLIEILKEMYSKKDGSVELKKRYNTYELIISLKEFKKNINKDVEIIDNKIDKKEDTEINSDISEIIIEKKEKIVKDFRRKL